MHVLKRLTFVVTLSFLSFGMAVSVAPTKAHAQSAGQLALLIEQRINPLEDELIIIGNAIDDAPNPFVATFLLAERQALLARIGSLTAIQSAALGGQFSPAQIAGLFELYTSIVSPDVPSVNT